MWRAFYAFFMIIHLAIGGNAKKRVCIVGAGIGGLVATKYFSEYPDEFEIVTFEKNSDVGGLWIYTNSTTVDEHGLPVHSSIYKSLRANAVKMMMTFPDYPDFGGKTEAGGYATHEEVLQYLKNYTDHFKLRPYIQTNTNVEQVKPLPGQRWLVNTKNLNTKQTNETECETVIVANGHDIKGYVPDITGIANFKGRVLHSHVYREPEPFANETVLVLGASFSGVDISVDVSTKAAKVYLSSRDATLPNVFPANVEQVPGVVAADGHELILSNGTRLRVDSLIYCTGYVYDFPFLDNSTGIFVEAGKYIHSLYKHLINVERPSMGIINVPQPSLHFRVPHAQVDYLRAVWRGKVILPNHNQMLDESKLPPNVPVSKAHVLAYDVLLKHLNELLSASGGPALPWWFSPAVDKIGALYKRDPVHFRNQKLVVNEKNRTVELVPFSNP